MRPLQAADRLDCGMSPLLNAEQAAELFNVPKSWILAEARADRIPHVRLGRYVRFDADALEAWWQTRARGPVTMASTRLKAPPHRVNGRGHGPGDRTP